MILGLSSFQFVQICYISMQKFGCHVNQKEKLKKPCHMISIVLYKRENNSKNFYSETIRIDSSFFKILWLTTKMAPPFGMIWIKYAHKGTMPGARNTTPKFGTLYYLPVFEVQLAPSGHALYYYDVLFCTRMP